MIIIKSDDDIKHIQESCRIVGYVLNKLYNLIKPGITTNLLNTIAEDLCLKKGAIPAFKGYRGFPYSICASVNDEVVHGFPNNKPLKKGDILSIDFGALYKGWYGDSAFTKAVGNVSKEIQGLIDTTEKCLYLGIQKAQPGNRLGDIGSVIQNLAESKGYGVIRNFVGHGIGKELHEEPQVLNYGKAGTGFLLKPGMVIAIEPMITLGTYDIRTLQDGWTVVTKDNKLSAHWEHTIAITNCGPKILTIRE